MLSSVSQSFLLLFLPCCCLLSQDSGTLPSLLDRSKLKLTKQSDVADVKGETITCNVSKIAERRTALSSR